MRIHMHCCEVDEFLTLIWFFLVVIVIFLVTVGLARDADVLVHEATNSYLTGVDKDTNLRTVTRDAVVHGHSTPHMAGDFAKRTNAKRLVLNHFSARYKGDQSVDSMSIMMRIEEQAIKASGLDTTNVAAAWDMMVLPIPRN